MNVYMHISDLMCILLFVFHCMYCLLYCCFGVINNNNNMFLTMDILDIRVCVCVCVCEIKNYSFFYMKHFIHSLTTHTCMY